MAPTPRGTKGTTTHRNGLTDFFEIVDGDGGLVPQDTINLERNGGIQGLGGLHHQRRAHHVLDVDRGCP